MADLPAGKLLVEVVSGPEGPCLVLGDNGSGERIAGPKPWGGGSTLFSFTVDAGDLIRIGKEYAQPQGEE